MREIRIKKGKHLASNQFTTPRFNLFGNGKLESVVMFDANAIYKTVDPQNQPDWNKLFGCSWGFKPLLKQYQMHENSSRWAWRYDPDREMFQVAPYVYICGIRLYPENAGFPIIELLAGQLVCLAIVPLKDERKVHFRYTKDVVNAPFGYEIGELKTLFTVEQPIPSLAGFVAPSYFGGTEPAPNDIMYRYQKA